MQNLCSVGKRVPKLDAVDKATGRIKYIQDLKVPGMLYGASMHTQKL
jgi:xanthine dehydrogenase molybdenum-binding subunit